MQKSDNSLFDDLKKELIELKLQNFEKEKSLKEFFEQLRSESTELTEEYEKKKNEYVHMINDIARKIRAESKDINTRKDELRLLDRNEEIKEHERRLIADVCRKEKMAMLIINNAAINLQKLYRGRKDRKLAAGLREKKNRKNGKKKGKK